MAKPKSTRQSNKQSRDKQNDEMKGKPKESKAETQTLKKPDRPKKREVSKSKTSEGVNKRTKRGSKLGNDKRKALMVTKHKKEVKIDEEEHFMVKEEVQVQVSSQNKKEMTEKTDQSNEESVEEIVKEKLRSPKPEVITECESSEKGPQPSKKIGAHVSMAGGLHNAVKNALEIDAHAFGLFLRNQRQWASKPLNDDDAEKFKKACAEAGYCPDVILPHGIYLMNCASPDGDALQKSRDTLIDEVKRCEKLGLKLYNFHPGSTCGKISVEEGIQRIAKSINDAHKETKEVVILIENMCCQGHTIGGKFEELRALIDHVNDKSRIGVCFDTCHAYAAGYDIAGKEQLNHTMELFDKVVGIQYLKAVHLNDSKGLCGCNLDRHENIGKGKIGMRGFRALMNDPRFNNIPMILETPDNDYKEEINKLYLQVIKSDSLT